MQAEHTEWEVQYSIDIDTGGTFTDGIVVNGHDARTVKVPTTPHDLTVCFAACIEACAKAFGLPVEGLLSRTTMIRFCNTIGTNTIIQRDGSRIGLMLTRGYEYLAPTAQGDAPAPLVAEDLVIGLSEAMSETGEPLLSPEITETLEVAQTLIDRGARALVVALTHSERNPTHEREVREIIKREYPREYLGSVPVFLASDTSTRSGYAERVNTAAINAYIHGKLARLLYKSGEDLRRREYPGVLFIGHNNGAMARVAKTRAINTYNSGPAAGLVGARALGQLYKTESVISTDMGGTSFDIGIIRHGRTRLTLDPTVEGFRCNIPMMSIRALGAGGGSLAGVVDGKLAVGPRSAGAAPGPACFDRGGTQPTVTDANLTLGLLDPEYFLGGAQRLDAARGRAAIDRHIAAPLGLSVEAAALRIRTEIERVMGRGVAEAARGLDPSTTMMVAYGGAGPLHSCAVAAQAGLERVLLTPFSAVFSAFSSSLMDVGHLYYRRLDVKLDGAAEIRSLSVAEESMRQEAHRDMRGEGFALESLTYELRLFIASSGESREVMAHAPTGHYRDASQWQRLIEMARAELERQGATEADPGQLLLTSVSLWVSAPTPHMGFSRPPAEKIARPAVDERQVYGEQGWSAVPVLDRTAIEPGATLAGPALIESPQTTLFVESGWRLTVDSYQNMMLSKDTQ